MLNQHSRIAVIAPSGPPSVAELDAGLEVLRSWGFDVLEAPHLRDVAQYTAGHRQARAHDLLWALTEAPVDAVWLARGGFGCVHCLPDLTVTHHVEERPLIGYSDATALFCALWQPHAVALPYKNLIHGPMVSELAHHADSQSQQHIRQLLLGQTIVQLRGQSVYNMHTSEVIGPMVGGNLCVLASLAGTPWALRSHGCIVVLEDINEPAYKIDRMLTQLLASGALTGAVAVVLGDFINQGVSQQANDAVRDVLKNLLFPLGIPLLTGVAVGHGPTNLAWRYGCMGVLRDDCTLCQADKLV